MRTRQTWPVVHRSYSRRHNPFPTAAALVFEDAAKSPVIILQHGDCVVDTAAAARGLSTKKLRVATPEAAEAATGYLVGGTSPFGTRTAVRVFVEESILALPKIVINGGGRGLLVEMAAQDLMTALPLLQPIRCAKAK